MKLLIYANNDVYNWKSWNDKINQLEDWFSGRLTLDITLQQTKFTDIQLSNDIDGNGKPFKAVDPIWFDNNVSLPALKLGYDAVLLVLEPYLWQGKQVQGLGTKPNIGIQEMAMIGNENAEYDFNGKKYGGGQFFNIARHELIHRIYDMLQKKDNTHLYFDNGKLEDCLKELSEPKTNYLVDMFRKKINKYKYFSEAEVDRWKLKPELWKIFDAIREEAGFPISINSGLRSKEENDKLKDSASNSGHLRGYEADIVCTDATKRDKLIELSYKHGITRRGIGNGFVHLGIDPSLPQHVMWTYYK